MAGRPQLNSLTSASEAKQKSNGKPFSLTPIEQEETYVSIKGKI